MPIKFSSTKTSSDNAPWRAQSPRGFVVCLHRFAIRLTIRQLRPAIAIARLPSPTAELSVIASGRIVTISIGEPSWKMTL